MGKEDIIQSALKGRDVIAPGEALGFQSRNCQALKGRNKFWITTGTPFQGYFAFACSTQGFALGCHILAFQALAQAESFLINGTT